MAAGSQEVWKHLCPLIVTEVRELKELPSTPAVSCSVWPFSVGTTQIVGQVHAQQFSSTITGKQFHKLMFERHLKPMPSSPLATTLSYIMGVKTVRCC